MSTDLKSKVPYYRFPTELAEQLAALEANPLLQRMKEVRRNHTDPHRPLYHYVNPEGSLNDPNGLCFWQGRWHLFYQGYPPEDSRQHWGHAVSDDLVRWHDLPYCIYPDPEYQCFSGSAFVEEDRVIAMYHGTRAGNMCATSSDPLLLNWDKVGNKPVIPIRSEDGSPLPYNVFDPCIWKKDGLYYSLSAGTERTGPGGKPVAADFLFRSEDLAHWEYLHSFIEDDHYTRVGDDGACPYFWPLGEKHILLFFSHSSGGQYLLGDYDKRRDKFVVTYGEKFNFGPPKPCGVHAPSATPNGDGTVTVIFNMNQGKPVTDWNQIMSLPRILSLGDDGDSVDMKPVAGVESLRKTEVRLDPFELTPNEEKVFKTLSGNSYELELELDTLSASAVELCVLRSPGKEEHTKISVFRDRGYFDRTRWERGANTFVTLDNSNSSTLPEAQCRAPETVDVPIPNGENVKLRVFVDRSVVEVFVNELRCVAARVYPIREDSLGVSLKAIGSPANVTALASWQMQSIYE